jgi:transcriptional regulator GlxA family with amidase domain
MAINQQKKLGILLYDNAQAMDIIGPWEVFYTWKKELQAPIEMYLVSENEQLVACDNKITLSSHCSFDDAPCFDYFLVPGGIGRKDQTNNKRVIDFLQKQAQGCEYVLSVCTGVFLLHKAGLLTNKKVTTYWRAFPELKELGDIEIIEQRIVQSGKFWFSGGISSGIDLALAFIAAVAAKKDAAKVQLLFEYFPSIRDYDLVNIDELPPYNPEADYQKAQIPRYIKTLLKIK